MKRLLICAVAAAILATLVATPVADAAPVSGTAVCPLPRFGPGLNYHPRIDPAQFSATVTSPLFPLIPGRTLVYTGVKDRKSAVDVVVPSRDTRVVDGVRTRIVEDRLFLDGVLEERTSDYYAQDRCANVWYFGEDTAELDEHGRVISTEGSFHAGIDGAQPGVYIQADPQLGRWFRQEWYRGQAEDTYRAVDRSTSIRVPYGLFNRAVRTEERTALEPNVIDGKWYVRGIGEVKETSLQGPQETLVLSAVLS
jgi:hypothetical protein